MEPKSLALHVADYGLEYILESLDIEPWTVLDLLIDRGDVGVQDLRELFREDQEEEEEEHDSFRI